MLRIKNQILEFVTFPIVKDDEGRLVSTRPDLHRKDQRGFENEILGALLTPVQAGEVTDE